MQLSVLRISHKYHAAVGHFLICVPNDCYYGVWSEDLLANGVKWVDFGVKWVTVCLSACLSVSPCVCLCLSTLSNILYICVMCISLVLLYALWGIQVFSDRYPASFWTRQCNTSYPHIHPHTYIQYFTHPDWLTVLIIYGKNTGFKRFNIFICVLY